MSSFKLVCEEVWTARGDEGGGVSGGKVLQLNYIVCAEETGADRQMAVDKCCWGTGWGGLQGVSRCSQGTKGGHKESL